MQFLSRFYHAITSDLLILPCPWCDQGKVQQKECSSHLAWDNLGPSSHPYRVQRLGQYVQNCLLMLMYSAIAPDTKGDRQLKEEPKKPVGQNAGEGA